MLVKVLQLRRRAGRVDEEDVTQIRDARVVAVDDFSDGVDLLHTLHRRCLLLCRGNIALVQHHLVRHQYLPCCLFLNFGIVQILGDVHRVDERHDTGEVE